MKCIKQRRPIEAWSGQPMKWIAVIEALVCDQLFYEYAMFPSNKTKFCVDLASLSSLALEKADDTDLEAELTDWRPYIGTVYWHCPTISDLNIVHTVLPSYPIDTTHPSIVEMLQATNIFSI